MQICGAGAEQNCSAAERLANRLAGNNIARAFGSRILTTALPPAVPVNATTATRPLREPLARPLERRDSVVQADRLPRRFAVCREEPPNPEP